MAQKVSERLHAAFGHRRLPDGLFYRFEFALRFELGGEVVTSAPRFLQAIDRARDIVRGAFPHLENLEVVLVRVSGARLDRSDARELRALRRIGFKRHLTSPERLPLEAGEEEFWSDCGGPPFRYLAAAEAQDRMTDIDALIWASCTRDTDVKPRADLDVYLIDYARRVVAHVYDERGMDVIAMTREPLVDLYRQFGPWLLDYDRARMDLTFGT